MKSKITVIVTIYNTPSEYLIKCIESIINQTLKEIEIILVNDGSTEEIRGICEKYKNKDSRIKLINQGNQGESVARNVGIENATTDNITFVDSDDWIEQDMCEKIYNYIEKIGKDYEIIIFNCYVDYPNKKIENIFYPVAGLLNQEDMEQIQLQNIEKGITKYYPPESNVSVIWSKVYNKEFINKNDLKFVPKIIRMPDAIFNMEAFEKAKKVYVLQENLYHYQKNGFSICQRYSKETINYYETYFKFVKKYIQKYNKNEKFVDTLNIKIVTSIDNYMYNYFLHRDNPQSIKYRKAEFRKLLDKELYQKAITEVKAKYLSLYQKMILKNAKDKNINNLFLLRKIKDILR